MKYACLLLLCIGLRAAFAGPPAEPLIKLSAVTPAAAPDCVIVELPADETDARQLFLLADNQPLTAGQLVARAGRRATFHLQHPLDPATPTSRLQAWLLTGVIPDDWLTRWPAGATLRAPLTTLGPGGTTAWLAAGTAIGNVAGRHWWIRSHGQPTARLDVRFAGDNEAFVAVFPLVADYSPSVGEVAEQWPTPAEHHMGSAGSAVSYVTDEDGRLVVWLPAPPDAACPPEPVVTYYHDGRLTGHGLVERRDDRFWYATFFPLDDVPNAAGKDVVATQPAPCPAIGDAVRVRTLADIAARRFAAQVFELSPDGVLLNAGEADGLHTGERLTVYRAGQELGMVELLRVQRSYAIARPVRGPNEPAPAVRVGDEVRCGPLPPRPRIVGHVTQVVAPGLFSATLAAPVSPLAPLAVRGPRGTLGVAVLLVVADEPGPADKRAAGVVLPDTQAGALQPGLRLELDAPTAAPH